MSQAMRLMEDKLGEKLNAAPGTSVLDAGCGVGNVAIRLARQHGLRITGVDILDWNIERARRKALAQRLNDRLKFEVMDYMELSFPDHHFDCVYTMETLVHAPDYQHALRQFYRVLKPEGRLVLFEYSVCRKEELTPEQRLGLDLVTEESGMHSLPHFIHGTFPDIVERAGFTDISVEEVTERVIPMFRRLSQIAYGPYQLIKLLKLQRQFINATSAVEGYRSLIQGDVWRYNLVVATKGA